MKINNRFDKIPYFPLVDMNNLLKHKNIINLAIGKPDLSSDERIVNEFKKYIDENTFNKCELLDGIYELKMEIIKYYKNNYDVTLTLDEVMILNGVSDGINNIIPAVCDIGNYIIIPKPSHPMYEGISRVLGVTPYKITLKEKNDYLPDIDYIPKEIIRKGKLFIINYPNNPTGAIANKNFYKSIINFCYEKDIILCNDGSYNEIVRPDHKSLSLLQFDSLKKCIELGSFSIPFNMSSFKISYAVGNKEVINVLKNIKNISNFGQCLPNQMAAIKALKLGKSHINNIRKVYDKRIAVAEKILSKLNIDYYKNKGSFYIWCKTPKNYTTDEFCDEAYTKAGVLFMPGHVFGNLCYDYFRISVTASQDEISRGLNNVGKII